MRDITLGEMGMSFLETLVRRLRRSAPETGAVKLRGTAQSVVDRIRAADEGSWFRVRLNGVGVDLPRYTLMTMRHCIHAGNDMPDLRVETAHWRAMLGELTDHTLFLDIGAATGAMSVPFAVQHPKARYVAFEPSPRAFRYLKDTALRNRADVKLFPYALSDQAGTLDFIEMPEASDGEAPYLPETSRLASGDDAIDHRATKHAVEVRTLDSIAEKIGIGDARKLVIKIDVEGFECNVLRGGIETIDRHRPVLAIDIHNYPGGNILTETEVIEILRPFGYAMHRMDHVLLFGEGDRLVHHHE